MKIKQSKKQIRDRKKAQRAAALPVSDTVAVVAANRAHAEAEAVRAGLKETLRLEAARTGEKVGRIPAEGSVRLKTRDGLASLHASGSLTDDQANAGFAYRLCFEAARSGLGCSLPSDVAVDKGERGDAGQLAVIYKMTRLNQMERAVGEVIEDGRELLVLRLVAGEGQTLSSLARGGNAKVAYLRALRRGLDAIAAIMAPKGLRIGDG